MVIAIACGWPGAVGAYPETVDRIVASVDYHALTQRDVETEFRFEDFVNGKMPAEAPDAASQKSIVDRLIEQTLLSEEEGTMPPAGRTRELAAEELKTIEKKFGSAEAFSSAIQTLGLSKEQVLQRLENRQAILQLIDRRLRPDAYVDASEISTYYSKTFLPAYTRENRGPVPPLSEVEGRIREILTQQKINKLLEDWLRELKSSHRVEIHSF
jgi:vacuolar-type H+-ATPase subunit I/STV1